MASLSTELRGEVHSWLSCTCDNWLQHDSAWRGGKRASVTWGLRIGCAVCVSRLTWGRQELQAGQWVLRALTEHWRSVGVRKQGNGPRWSWADRLMGPGCEMKGRHQKHPQQSGKLVTQPKDCLAN